MEELEQIVQRMVVAGESEENIKLVIETYNRKLGKTNGVAAPDAAVTPQPVSDDMGLASGSIFSAYQASVSGLPEGGQVPSYVQEKLNRTELQKIKEQYPGVQVDSETTWVDVERKIAQSKVVDETTEQHVANIHEARNSITPEDLSVKTNLANDYFSLDSTVKSDGVEYANFAEFRKREENYTPSELKGTIFSFGLAFKESSQYQSQFFNTEEQDLQLYFEAKARAKGETAQSLPIYEHYVNWRDNQEFDNNLVESGKVDESVKLEQRRASEAVAMGIDDDEEREKAQRYVQLGVYDMFDPSDPPEYLQDYAEALESDFKAQDKLDELGRVERVMVEGMIASGEEGYANEAPEALANYINYKIKNLNDETKSFTKDSKTYNEEYSKVDKEFVVISEELEKLGTVNEYSSPEKIEAYNNLAARFGTAQESFTQTISSLGLDDLNERDANLKSKIEKFIENSGKINDADMAAKAFAMSYNSLDNMVLSAATGLAETNLLLKFAGKQMHHLKTGGTSIGVDAAIEARLEENYQDAISYKESIVKHKEARQPLDVRWQDVKFTGPNSNFGEAANQLLSNNIVSIGAALSFGGAAGAARYAAGKKIITTTTEKAINKMAGNAVKTLFFGLEGGAKLSQLETAQRDAKVALPKLRSMLGAATTLEERSEILKLIEKNEDALSVTEAQKGFSAALYGGIATYAETVGTMRLMTQMARAIPGMGPMSFKNAIRAAGGVGYGVGVELVEEGLTEIGHNITDYAVLKENKSFLTGLDADFAMNVIFSSLAIQGPSMVKNVGLTLQSEVQTLQELKKNTAYKNEIIQLQLNYEKAAKAGAPQSTLANIETAINSKIRESALGQAYTFADVANMTNGEIRELFENKAKMRDNNNSARDVGVRADAIGKSDRTEGELQKLRDKNNELQSRNEELRRRPEDRRTEALEKVLGKGNAGVDTHFEFGKYQQYLNISNAIHGTESTVVKTTKEFNELAAKALKKGTITQKDHDDYVRGVKEGHYATFIGDNLIFIEENIINDLNDPNLSPIDKSFIAYSPIHELQHLRDAQVGLVENGEVVESQKAVVASLITHLDNMFAQGKIKQTEYNAAKSRIAIYTKKGVVDLSELKPIFGEFMNAGIISKDSSGGVIEGVLKNFFNSVAREIFGDKAMFMKFKDANDVLEYIRSFQKSVVSGALSIQVPPEKEEDAAKFSKSIEQDINKLMRNPDGSIMTKKEWDRVGLVDAYDKLINGRVLDALIVKGIEGDAVYGVPIEDFKQRVKDELAGTIMRFNPEQNDNLSGWIGAQVGFRKGDVLNSLKKIAPERISIDVEVGAEGGATFAEMVETEDTAQQELEEKDFSITAQARKKKAVKEGEAEAQRQSKFRRKLGFETGGEFYNKILDETRKRLLLAYSSTQKIKDVDLRVKGIVKQLKEDFSSLNSPLFKQIKNFLTYGVAVEGRVSGKANKYIPNLKEFREAMIDVMSTADLVQMERNTPEGERIFTRFVKKLTSVQEVQDAVDQNLLPPDALNKITKDQKTGKGAFSVNLYQKVMPTESEFISYADQPAVKPHKTTPGVMVKSGLKGTRKDGLVKRVAEGLALDALMEVRQSEEVASRLTDDVAAQMDVEKLGAAIGRETNVKFSKALQVEFSKAQNAVKFSLKLTKPQTKRKLLTTLDKLIREQSDDSFVKSALMELRFSAELGLDLRDVTIGGIPAAQIIDIDAVIQDVKNIKVGEIRRIGHTAFVELLAKASEKQILRFVKNVFRSSRSSMVFGITSNRLLKERVLDVIQNGTYKGRFELVKSKFGEKLTFDGKVVELYEDTTNIKKNARNPKSGITELVNKQAEEARAFILEVLGDKKISKGDRIAMLQLMAYDQRGALRKVSKMGITLNEDIKIPVGKLTLEHEITINDMVDVLIDFINEKPGSKKAVEEMFDNSYVHVLPKQIDTVLGGIKIDGVSYKSRGGLNRYMHAEVLEYLQKLESKGIVTLPSRLKFIKAQQFQKIDNAISESRKPSWSKSPKGITVLDFDDTLATTKSMIRFTRPDGTKGKLNAEQYASTYQDLSDQGYKWDFSEFDRVVDGETAPLFNKALKLQSKFGSKNMFVLTARSMEAAQAIHTFLKANGLNIPLKNIAGLGNSTSEAKALWIADKVGEGYNDFYFADDALQNVQAVENMLSQFDVKSKVQQAKIKFSKSIDTEFNKMLERSKGISAETIIDRAVAKQRGKNVGRFEFFIAPGADDFAGLMMRLEGKGKRGEQDRLWFKEALYDPYNRAYREINQVRYNIVNDYSALAKTIPGINKKLKKNLEGTDFTTEQAVRIYAWKKSGFEVPGLSEKAVENIVAKVSEDVELVKFVEGLRKLMRTEEGYVKPGDHWTAQTIQSDLHNVVEKVHRDNALAEWQQNADQIFTEDNLSKLEALMGTKYSEALRDILYRMKTGKNRPSGSNVEVNKWMNWVNGSVGAIMFLNMRSAVLQTISTVNYINFGDNNVFKAAKAFANQKQFWADFVMIFNSPMLKARRAGLQQDVNQAELADALAGAKNSPQAVIAYLLKIGFAPTQIADSFAIAMGGSTFFRNRTKKYVAEGMTQQEAEKQAFTEFQSITEENQQSSRPDRISQQQASVLGRIILAFMNTPMQYNRIIKKAAGDIVNKRGDIKTHVSKIMYYGVAQSIIFYSLQSALFGLAFDEDEEEAVIDKKIDRVAQGMVDSIVRGSGLKGAVLSTIKNTYLKFKEEATKGWKADYGNVLVELFNLSPPLGSKARKVYSSFKTYKYNREIMKHMSLMDIDNPTWSMVSTITEAGTNIPLHRLLTKFSNMREALDQDNAAWQRVAVGLGWNQWSVGIDPYEETKKAKAELKAKKKKDKKKKDGKKSRCTASTSDGTRCKNMTTNKNKRCYAHQ